MKKVLFLICFLSLASVAFAQAANTLVYDYSALPTEVSTYTQTITVDNVLVPTSPTCVTKGTTETTCSVIIPTLTAGTHTISITALKNGVSAQTIVTGLNPNNAPKNANNIRINITVNINIP